MRFHIKTYRACSSGLFHECFHFFTVFGADDGTDFYILAVRMSRYYGNIASHNFHFSQAEGQRAAVSFAQNESFRTDADGYRLVSNLAAIWRSYIKETVLADPEAVLFDTSVEDIDWRRTQELGYKQVFRIVVNILRFADLLEQVQDEKIANEKDALLNAAAAFLSKEK